MTHSNIPFVTYEVNINNRKLIIVGNTGCGQYQTPEKDGVLDIDNLVAIDVREKKIFTLEKAMGLPIESRGPCANSYYHWEYAIVRNCLEATEVGAITDEIIPLVDGWFKKGRAMDPTVVRSML